VSTTPSVCWMCYLLDYSHFCTEPVVLVGALEGSFLASFLLGWGVTIGAGLASYPLDTIRLVISFVGMSHLTETSSVVA
jgi:hypothetical protein